MKYRRHVRMGHRDVLALPDLSLKDRHDACAAAQDVSETHTAEPGVRARGRQRLHDHLGDALRRSHGARGIHGLVGGDEHKHLRAKDVREFCHVPRAHHVIQNGFGRVVLHERHMLVGGGMKHDLRPVKREELFHDVEIADVRDHFDHLLEVFAYFARDLVKVVFVLIQKNQLRRLKPLQLPDEFGSDRATSAGDENPAPR